MSYLFMNAPYYWRLDLLKIVSGQRWVSVLNWSLRFSKCRAVNKNVRSTDDIQLLCLLQRYWVKIELPKAPPYKIQFRTNKLFKHERKERMLKID